MFRTLLSSFEETATVEEILHPIVEYLPKSYFSIENAPQIFEDRREHDKPVSICYKTIQVCGMLILIAVYLAPVVMIDFAQFGWGN
jgi:hypothetical protein